MFEFVKKKEYHKVKEYPRVERKNVICSIPVKKFNNNIRLLEPMLNRKVIANLFNMTEEDINRIMLNK